MKRYISIITIGLFFSGCTEYFPEYKPFLEEPRSESSIPVNPTNLPKVSLGGTVWSVFHNRIYSLNNGEISSQNAMVAFYDNYANFVTSGVNAFYLSRNHLVKVNSDSSTVITTPSNDNYYYTLFESANNIFLFPRTGYATSYDKFWIFSENGWVQKPIPSSVFDWVIEQAFDEERVCNNFVVYSEYSNHYAHFFNLNNGELTTFNQSLYDQYQSVVYPVFEKQCMDSQGNSYAISKDETLVKYNPINGTAQVLSNIIPGVSNYQIKKVRVNSNGDLWVVFIKDFSPVNYIYKFGQQSYQALSSSYSSENPSNIRFHVDFSGKLWVVPSHLTYSRNIEVYNNSGIVTSRAFEYIESELNLKEDNNGNVWVSNLNGNATYTLHKYSNEQWTDLSSNFYVNN